MMMEEVVVEEEAEAGGRGEGGQLLFEWPKWPNDPRPGKRLLCVCVCVCVNVCVCVYV